MERNGQRKGRGAYLHDLPDRRLMRLFRNPKGAVYAILAFVAILLLLFSVKSRGEQTLEFEAGAAVLRGETPVIGLTIGCPECGPVNTSYEFGFDLVGDSHDYEDSPNSIGPRVMLVDGYKKFEAGLGFQWWNVATGYTCQFTFALMARYRATDRVAVQWRHSSSAGSCRPNVGRDLVTVAWRF
jgi:hypothetical protein